MVRPRGVGHRRGMPRRTDDDLRARLAQRVRALRNARGLTQEALSELSGVQAQTISRIENEVLTPSLAAALALADGLGLTVNALLDRDEPTAPVLSDAELKWVELHRSLTREQAPTAARIVKALRAKGHSRDRRDLIGPSPGRASWWPRAPRAYRDARPGAAPRSRCALIALSVARGRFGFCGRRG